MPFKSYVNDITAEEVSIALEHLLVAPYGTAWTIGRVDVSSPPASFIHLGAVAEDSPQVSVQKNKYQLATGIPATLRYQAVVGLAGAIQMTLLSNRNSRIYHALGGIKPQHAANTPAEAWAVVTSTGAGSHVRTSFYVNSIAHAAAVTVGNMIVVDTSATILTTLNEAFINSIVAGSFAEGNGYLFYLSNPDGLPRAPANREPMFRILHNRYAMGTIVLPQFRILGVADFLNGSQVVHDFQRVQPMSQFVETLRTGQEARVPLGFDLFGYQVNTPYDSNDQTVVSERFWFPPTSVGL